VTYSVRIPLEPRGYHVGSMVLDLVAELRQSGLVMNQDFEWRYQKSSYGEGNEHVPASVTFEFEDPALATFYQLKWSAP
jgi:hypothetical protein